MLKMILLIDDSPHLVTFNSLQQNCRTLARCKTESEVEKKMGDASLVVLHTPAAKLADWEAVIASRRRLPVVWLCTEEAVPEEIEWGYSLDSVIAPSMTRTEMGVALKWALRSYQQRKRWAEERDQLLQRLEERKWIDQAKAVLCEVKGISEAEAYDFLRKQAMNERKRIGDIAASIVKVYQLIHG